MVDPTMLNNHLAQFLDRGLCPTVDLMVLNTSINIKEGFAYVNRKPAKQFACRGNH